MYIKVNSCERGVIKTPWAVGPMPCSISLKNTSVGYDILPVRMLYCFAVVGFSKKNVYSFGTNVLVLPSPNSD